MKSSSSGTEINNFNKVMKIFIKTIFFHAHRNFKSKFPQKNGWLWIPSPWELSSTHLMNILFSSLSLIDLLKLVHIVTTGLRALQSYGGVVNRTCLGQWIRCCVRLWVRFGSHEPHFTVRFQAVWKRVRSTCLQLSSCLWISYLTFLTLKSKDIPPSSCSNLCASFLELGSGPKGVLRGWVDIFWLQYHNRAPWKNY